MRFDEIDGTLALWHSVDSRAQDFLGSHRKNGIWVFRVWAPHAKRVSVTGEFCDWSRDGVPMERISKNGVWEAKVKNLEQYTSYKYVIETYDGRIIYKADMYANHFETRPGTASKLYHFPRFAWKDKKWLEQRAQADHFNRPMNIYELHAGSWKRDGEREPTYLELCGELLDYVVEMGYTHIELMPVTEYPYDKSWGYQVTGYFAPTSRYGTPQDFKTFVNACHQRGVGVIMDWVPAHFPKDEMGLYEYDGQPLYEYEDPLKREHRDWGTRVFDYSKPEVASFLISSACHWLDTYHIDGLRVDAVASMLYLDYGRKDGDFRPNIYGGNGNLEAAEFIKLFNTLVHLDRPGVFTIAEESTAWPLVTAPVENGGLGFDYKWNMGWMNDTLQYMSNTYENRRGMQNKMSFSTSYAFSENFILALSHDEVVHGKCSLIEKMPGYYEDKFANLRTYMAYMYTHPGKKLLFMGGEFAHFREWDESVSLDWFLLDYPIHAQFQTYMKDLNHLYLTQKPLYEQDNSYCGFQWISADDSRNSVYVYRRIDRQGNEILVFLNFSAYLLEHYCIGVPHTGEYSLLFSGDSPQYGGAGRHLSSFTARDGGMHGLPYYAEVTLPPFSALMYQYKGGSYDQQK